ncbi:MAG TPA: hypothetical protein PLF13_02620 [candidate division Zixibacteria bacterium]|nr:hypothetical protein [candidate division Zixibacteria bacterium]
MLLFIAITMLICAPVQGNQILELADELRLPLPTGWTVDSAGVGYPYRLTSPDSSSEMLIFKSLIAEDLAVTSREDFRLSVDSIIESVIMQLPQAELLTNHGYSEGGRAWFVLEFVTTDTIISLSLWHRLQGTLYRCPDGDQLMYTLWGRRPITVASDIGESFRVMQDGLAYRGPVMNDVFSSPIRFSNWHFVALFVVLLMLLWLRKRDQQKVEFSNQENIWRCECGRLNHIDNKTCRRCGRSRTGAPVI